MYIDPSCLHTHKTHDVLSPKVGVECLKLGKVAVKGGDVSGSNTAECTDFENIT